MSERPRSFIRPRRSAPAAALLACLGVATLAIGGAGCGESSSDATDAGVTDTTGSDVDDGQARITNAATSAVAPIDGQPFTMVATPPVAETAAAFGPEGGSLLIGDVEFIVPPGAVDEITPLMVSRFDVDLPEGVGARGDLYGCEARGATFDPPMQVVFTFDEPLDADTVIAWTNDAGELEILDTTVDGRTATIETSHCSRAIDGLLTGVQAALAANELRETIENSECPDGHTEVSSGRCCPDGYTAIDEGCYRCAEGQVPGPVPEDLIEGGIGCYPSPVGGTDECPVFCRWESEDFRGAACCPDSHICPAPGDNLCLEVVLSCEEEGDVVVRACDGYHCCEDGTFAWGCPAESCRWDDPCNPHEGEPPCDPLVSCSLARRDLDGDGLDDVWCGMCPPGYKGLGWVACEDVNECDDESICYEGAECVNSPGSFACECRAATCDCRRTPRNEQPPGCLPSSICEVDEEGASRCVDRDECVDGILTADGEVRDACAAGEICINEPREGSSPGFRCECPEGYDRLNDAMTCQDIDECARFDCGVNRHCTNTDGGHTCGACIDGFEDADGDDIGDCVDIDECAADGCDPLTRCENTSGGFTCTDCPRGYTGDGVSGCVDIDECLIENGYCGAAECVNAPGSYTCGECPEGTTEDDRGACVDIDDCLTDNGGCDPLVTCDDDGTDVTCGACPDPYLGDGYEGCRLCHTSDGVGAIGWGPAERVTEGGASVNDMAVLGNGQAVIAGVDAADMPFFVQREAPGTWADAWAADYDGVDAWTASVDARGDVGAGVWTDARFEATTNAARLGCEGWALDGDVSTAAIPDARAQSTDVAILPDGTIVAGWFYLDRDPRVAVRSGDGTWGTPVTLDAPGAAESMRFDVDEDGTLHASWLAYDEDDDTYAVVWATRDPDAGTWSTPATISTGEISSYAVVSAFDVGPSGQAIVAWCDDVGVGSPFGPNSGPSVRTWDAASGWSDTVRTAEGTECEIFEGEEPAGGDDRVDYAVHYTGDGDAFFAWEDTDGALRVVFETPEDDTFGAATTVTTGGVADVAFFSVCRRPSCGGGFGDDAFLVWSSATGISAVQWDHVRKRWSEPTLLRPMDTTTSLVTASTSNGAYLAWTEGGDVWLRRWGMDSGP